MSIIYFADRVYKKSVPAIDSVMAKRNIQVVSGFQDITSTALDVVISQPTGWHIDNMQFTFSNATSRTYAASIMNGTKILTNLNDYLWFIVDGSIWQKITLNPGFYSGTQLATELQTQLNSNTAFSDLSRTFTVAYDAVTGLFTITANSGLLKYINKNNTQQMSARDSIAGHCFGFNHDSAFDSNVIVSDTAVPGLNQEAYVFNNTSNTVTNDFENTIHVLSMDQALHLTTNTAAVAINYSVGYELIV